MITEKEIDEVLDLFAVDYNSAPMIDLVNQVLKERDAYREAFILHICDQMGYPGAERDIAEKVVDKAAKWASTLNGGASAVGEGERYCLYCSKHKHQPSRDPLYCPNKTINPNAEDKD